MATVHRLVVRMLVPLAEVIEHVAWETGGSFGAGVAKPKRAWVVWQRTAAVWLANVVAGYRAHEIAAAFDTPGLARSATIRRADQWRLTDRDFRELTDTVAAQLRSAAADRLSRLGQIR